MRREFILVLIGIISVSTLSSFLSSYVQIEIEKLLLDTVVGVVGAGNFSYWQLGHSGPLLIELTSLSGDADIYVSDSVRPSFEVDRNNFSSETCGPDLVKIPMDFPRPIGIGVFGSWSHSVSEYSIQVFLDTAELQLLRSDFHTVNVDKSDISNQYKEIPIPKKTEEDKPRRKSRALATPFSLKKLLNHLLDPSTDPPLPKVRDGPKGIEIWEWSKEIYTWNPTNFTD